MNRAIGVELGWIPISSMTTVVDGCLFMALAAANCGYHDQYPPPLAKVSVDVQSGTSHLLDGSKIGTIDAKYENGIRR